MKGPVRAKFRCLSITHKWDDSWLIELGPVMQRGEHSEENKSFWEASPSGECHLTYQVEHDLKIGAYYYIDMVPNDDGQWELASVMQYGQGSGEIFMSHYRTYDYQKPIPAGLLRGNLKIGIDGKKTEALKTFGNPGGKWDVKLTFAEASDD